MGEEKLQKKLVARRTMKMIFLLFEVNLREKSMPEIGLVSWPSLPCPPPEGLR